MSKERNSADVEFIRALAQLLNENDLTELTVERSYGEDDALNVHLSRRVESVPAAPAAVAAPAAAPRAEAPATPPVSDDPAQHPGAVTSPMVGTVYLQAEPGQPPFVGIGSAVTEGQTLLIIEAMKTMNQIPAPRSGTVKRILVSDGSPVEYGAPLMIVE